MVLIFCLGLPGWLLLRLGLGKLIRKWVESLEYRMDEAHLYASWRVSLWGLMLSRGHCAVPLKKITDVRLVQGPLQHALGLWNIVIQTAGRGSAWPEMTLYALRDPQQARDEILAAIEADRSPSP